MNAKEAEWLEAELETVREERDELEEMAQEGALGDCYSPREAYDQIRGELDHFSRGDWRAPSFSFTTWTYCLEAAKAFGWQPAGTLPPPGPGDHSLFGEPGTDPDWAAITTWAPIRPLPSPTPEGLDGDSNQGLRKALSCRSDSAARYRDAMGRAIMAVA